MQWANVTTIAAELKNVKMHCFSWLMFKKHLVAKVNIFTQVRVSVIIEQ